MKTSLVLGDDLAQRQISIGSNRKHELNHKTGFVFKNPTRTPPLPLCAPSSESSGESWRDNFDQERCPSRIRNDQAIADVAAKVETFNQDGRALSAPK